MIRKKLPHEETLVVNPDKVMAFGKGFSREDLENEYAKILAAEMKRNLYVAKPGITHEVEKQVATRTLMYMFHLLQQVKDEEKTITREQTIRLIEDTVKKIESIVLEETNA